jgi:hypothetical protein
MACSNLLLISAIEGNCNNLGGIGSTVWFGNYDDLEGYTASVNGIVSELTFKAGTGLLPVRTNQLQNHYESGIEQVGGQKLQNHTVTVMGGAVKATVATSNDWNLWDGLIGAENLFAICQNQTTDDTNAHFVILGLDNGLSTASGDGFTSGTARMDLSNVTVVRSGVSAKGPRPFVAGAAPNLVADLAAIVAYEI